MKTRLSAVAVEPQEISWSAEFMDKVRRCQPMQAFVYEYGEFEVNLFSNLQPMELTKNRSDVVEFRRRRNQPSSCIHYRLELLKKMCWDADRVELPKSSRDKTSDDMSDWRTGLDTDRWMLRS